MNMVTKTSEEIKAWATSPEGQANLAETIARLKAKEDVPPVEDPENPWITDFSGWMTFDEAKAFRTSRKNQPATV
jgi:hypothetical protein